MTDQYEQSSQQHNYETAGQAESSEKMVTLPQSQIDKIVGSARTKGYERGAQEASRYYSPPVDESAQYTAGKQQAPRVLTEDAANELVNRRLAEIEKQRQQAEQQRQEQQQAEQFTRYYHQVNRTLTEQALSAEVKSRNPDLIKKIQDEGGFDDEYLFPVKAIASEFDNGVEILGHLVDNPSLASNIANHHKPEWKRKALAKISKELKADYDAQNTPTHNLPTGNVKSSPGVSVNGNGTGANKKITWESIRGKYNN